MFLSYNKNIGGHSVTKHRPQKHANLLANIRKCIEEGRYLETIHAQIRQHQRLIILSDIIKVLLTGYHEAKKDKFDSTYGAWNYAICGHAKGSRGDASDRFV
jgi:hypothetical protein